jgi:hypothetical protein
VFFFHNGFGARKTDTQEDYFHCGGKAQKVLDKRLENTRFGLDKLNSNYGLAETIKLR